jgi:hypothetical protein
VIFSKSDFFLSSLSINIHVRIRVENAREGKIC